MSEDDELDVRARARRTELEAGFFRHGVSPEVNAEQPPPWYEPETFRHAQTLAKDYLAVIALSHLYGLILILHLSDGLAPLLATGHSETVPKLFTRYLATIVHVHKWFAHDPFDPSSAAYRSLKVVRGMHRQVGEKMNQRSGRVADGKTKLWVSQYAMTRTQFAFMGLMAIFPKQLGFVRFTPADFHSLYHFWRVIGHCIGIEDRFNLCNGGDELIVEVCRQMYTEEWLPVLLRAQAANGTGARMGEGIVLALQHVIPDVKFNALLRYAAPFLQLNPDHYPLRTWAERYAYWKGTWTPVVFRSLWFNRYASWKAQRSVLHAVEQRNAYRERLQQQYAELRYTDHTICPFRLGDFAYTETLADTSKGDLVNIA